MADRELQGGMVVARPGRGWRTENREEQSDTHPFLLGGSWSYRDKHETARCVWGTSGRKILPELRLGPAGAE